VFDWNTSVQSVKEKETRKLIDIKSYAGNWVELIFSGEIYVGYIAYKGIIGYQFIDDKFTVGDPLYNGN